MRSPIISTPGFALDVQGKLERIKTSQYGAYCEGLSSTVAIGVVEDIQAFLSKI